MIPAHHYGILNSPSCCQYYHPEARTAISQTILVQFSKKKSLLPGPMMTNNSDAMWHHWATFNQFHKIAVTCVLSTGFVATWWYTSILCFLLIHTFDDVFFIMQLMLQCGTSIPTSPIWASLFICTIYLFIVIVTCSLQTTQYVLFKVLSNYAMALRRHIFLSWSSIYSHALVVISPRIALQVLSLINNCYG